MLGHTPQTSSESKAFLSLTGKSVSTHTSHPKDCSVAVKTSRSTVSCLSVNAGSSLGLLAKYRPTGVSAVSSGVAGVAINSSPKCQGCKTPTVGPSPLSALLQAVFSIGPVAEGSVWARFLTVAEIFNPEPIVRTASWSVSEERTHATQPQSEGEVAGTEKITGHDLLHACAGNASPALAPLRSKAWTH